MVPCYGLCLLKSNETINCWVKKQHCDATRIDSFKMATISKNPLNLFLSSNTVYFKRISKIRWEINLSYNLSKSWREGRMCKLNLSVFRTSSEHSIAAPCRNIFRTLLWCAKKALPNVLIAPAFFRCGSTENRWKNC